MADVNQSLPEGTNAITARGKPAFVSMGKTGHHTQQTGFATAVGAAQPEQLPRLAVKIKIPEQPLARSAAAQTRRFQPRGR